MVWKTCDNCGKTLSSYQSLWRHKSKSCTGRQSNNMHSDNLARHKKVCGSKIGSGLLYPTTNSSFLSGKHRLHRQESEDRSRLDSTKQMEVESSSDSANDDLTDTESEDSGTSDDDYDDNEDSYFWYVVYQTCKRKDAEHFLDACAGYLFLYVRSKDDDLFQSIVDNTSKLEEGGMEFEKALAASILKHKLSIALKVNRCKLDDGDHGEISSKRRKLSESEDEDDDDDDGDDESDSANNDGDELGIWCELSRKSVKPGCKWFTGETCSCKRCDGASILKTVVWFAYVFHAIEEDDLALEISEKLEKCQDLYDKLIPTVKQYRKDILVKYANVKDELSDSDGIIKRPRKLTWLFNYIDKNKDL